MSSSRPSAGTPGPRRRRTETVRARPRTARPVRPAELGGHLVRKRGAQSMCLQCRVTSCNHVAFAAKRCKGSAVQAWAERACRDAETGCEDGGGHARRLTDGVLWCDLCGAYAERRAMGLAEPCKKRPRDPTAAWRRDRLRRRVHPATGCSLTGPTVIEPRSFVSAGEGAPVSSAVSGPPASAPFQAGSLRFQAILQRVRLREASCIAAGQ